MNIIYAAEKPSIAGILSDYLHTNVKPQEIDVCDNPDETGSFLIKWDIHRFIMSPDGQVESELQLA